VPVVAQPGDNDAGRVGVLAAGDGRVDPDHDTGERLGCLGDAGVVEQLAGEQGAFDVLDQLAEQLLAAQAGALVAKPHLLQRGLRQVRLVVPGGAAHGEHAAVVAGQQLTQQRHRPRRGGDEHPGPFPDAQRRHQRLGPQLFEVDHRGHLVDPRPGQVGPAQPVRAIGRVAPDF
jgi:hypothetical protein